MSPHDFETSLAKSHAAEDWPLWEVIYRQAFPDFASMVNHRQDGWHQRQGIDRSVTLTNSKHILIDEKARGRNAKTGKVYDDIALEYWSDYERGIAGWVCKSLLADYIAYAILPLGKCYLLPVLQLQAAWRKRGQSWIDRTKDTTQHEFFLVKAENPTWTTYSVGVPVKILFAEISECLRLNFEPREYAEAVTAL